MIFFVFAFDIDPGKKTLVMCMSDGISDTVGKNLSDVVGVPVTR